jgi:putative transposase
VYAHLPYTVYMSSQCRSNRNVVFSCKFRIVWCPKYRRSVLVNGADERMKKIIARVCEARSAQLIELEVMPDHVHLLVDVDPQFGVHQLVKEIKRTGSHELRLDFAFLKRRLPTLWTTNSYFVCTVGGAPRAIVKQYIENQKHV